MGIRKPERAARVKSPEMVKAEFRERGITVRDWAVQHGINENIVYNLLNGIGKGHRGESHRAAVLLGMKRGANGAGAGAGQG